LIYIFESNLSSPHLPFFPFISKLDSFQRQVESKLEAFQGHVESKLETFQGQIEGLGQEVVSLSYPE